VPHKVSEGLFLGEALWTVITLKPIHRADAGTSRSLVKVDSSQWNNIISLCCPSVLLMSRISFPKGL